MLLLYIILYYLKAYAQSADDKLQKEVAEKLANEAVNPVRQKQIVEYGGLKLLVPLINSRNIEVQRLSAHALANLSVNSENQIVMAREGAIEMLVQLLDSDVEQIQRQSAKALANLGVNVDNKRSIADKGGIPQLIRLASNSSIPVRIECIAALANLAVNDYNEVEIVRLGGLGPIVASTALASDNLRGGGSDSPDDGGANIEELGAQCARALRNLSVNPSNKEAIVRLGTKEYLEVLAVSTNDRISQQARRALRNLDTETKK
jgi:hypothetical protein